MPASQYPTQSCSRCGDTGWLCAATDKPADFEHGTCCNPTASEEFTLGPDCPSANGCPDCTRAGDGFATYEETP